MDLLLNNPKQSLNKAFLKEKVGRNEIELFKQNLKTLFGNIGHKGDEEHLKSQVAYFLRDTWYKGTHQINPIEKKDLAIHIGKSVDDPIGVIIEVKSIANRHEMISEAKGNVKALHELILYYFRERVERKNNEIKYLIVTNIEEWYIFDANEFDRKIYQNTSIRKLYELKRNDLKNNPFFYEELSKILAQSDIRLEGSMFNLLDYQTIIENESKSDDAKLIALYKILSPVNLLKIPFLNDSNSLDKDFYRELLHIIGLEEIKEGNKKLITRQEITNPATLIENTILKINDKDCLENVVDVERFGNQSEDILFSISLELCITWINRILFLKLLEAQLFKYHNGNKDYSFLNSDLVFDFDELNNLFFQVLAEKEKSRYDHFRLKFKKVPYLNSSLFERTELEKQTFDISALDNRLELNLHTDTVLKDHRGKKNTGSRNTLKYLFEFLDAYDFTSEGSEEIQEENKNLINASVLGLIFEKINGYKDGSFFTPGFVTMFICKESIRKTIVQKFNDRLNLDCADFNDLKNFIGSKFKSSDILEFNKIVNEIKICDPAVGSGHFLVSALNEIISSKAELGILADKDGVKLNGYEVRIENDELIITYNNNTEIFNYSVNNKAVNNEIQRVQSTIFHEKEIIIENCLFGVDLNENSVKICRLRLWIELLKHTYYREESKFTELETLPNIDINIKCGNSLISRFALKDDVFEKIPNFIKKLNDYKYWVSKYKITDDKSLKKQLIQNIKLFVDDFKKRDPRLVDLEKKQVAKKEEYFFKFQTDQLFGQQLSKDQEKLKQKLEADMTVLDLNIDEIRNNKSYKNAFEWRYEFPEVLDSDGNYLGFDLLIGNPPWGAEMEKNDLAIIKKENQDIVVRMIDSFMFFINKSFGLKNKSGIISMIVPDVLLYQVDNEKLRAKLINKSHLDLLINLGDNIFEDVARASAIFLVTTNGVGTKTLVGNYRKRNGIPITEISLESVTSNLFEKLPYHVFPTENIKGYDLLARLDKTRLENFIDSDGIQRGVSPDLKEAFVINDVIVEENLLEKYKIKNTITGGVDLKKYSISISKKRLIYTSNDDSASDIPNIVKFVESFSSRITCKEAKTGKHKLYALHRSRDENIFLKESKIIGVITSDKIITALDTEKLYPTDGLYLFGCNELADPKYIIAVLNSKVATYLYRANASKFV